MSDEESAKYLDHLLVVLTQCDEEEPRHETHPGVYREAHRIITTLRAQVADKDAMIDTVLEDIDAMRTSRWGLWCKIHDLETQLSPAQKELKEAG